MGRMYNMNDRFFETWNEDMAYVLGFITADGSIDKHNGLSIGIQVSDIEVLEYIKSVMEIENPILTYNDKNSQISKLCVHSDKICSDLLLLNVTNNKTYTIVAPPFIPDNMIWHYIRGLFDGDGCIHLRDRGGKFKQKNAEVYLDTASEIYAEQINKVLNDKGIRSKIYRKQDSRIGRVPMYRVCISGREVLSFGEYLYKDAKFYLKRKYDKFQEYYTNRFTNCKVCGKSFYCDNIQTTRCDDCKSSNLRD
jgi:hypothetical protein